MQLSAWRLAVVCAGLLVIGMPNVAAAQEATGIARTGLRGIKHVLYLVVGADRDSPLVQDKSTESQAATIAIITRISAHSQQTNFYGDVRSVVADFDLRKGSPTRQIWQDARCHQERGFPKTTVIGIAGSVTTPQRQFPVSARFRVLGMKLPGDEVMASRRLADGTDDIGAYIATRTETKQSRLFVDLKLYTLPCDLGS